MKPSIIKNIFPCGSVKKKTEAEVIAQNIIKILARTSDAFRELTWKEYKEERRNDGDFSENEEGYFDSVLKYTTSPVMAARFSEDWAKALDKSESSA